MGAIMVVYCYSNLVDLLFTLPGQWLFSWSEMITPALM